MSFGLGQRKIFDAKIHEISTKDNVDLRLLNPPPVKGLDIRITMIVPMRGGGSINHRSTLSHISILFWDSRHLV